MLSNFIMLKERLSRAFVWLSRICYCRGFGVQSPTDYHFVRYVINEHWPYYAYETLGDGASGKMHRLGLLCFRLANWRQPRVVLDGGGMAHYVRAACKNAVIRTGDETSLLNAHHTRPVAVELAIEPVTIDTQLLFPYCDDRSVILFLEINRHKADWRRIVDDPRVTISYDLYDCGIVMFGSKRAKQHYIINF